MKSAVHGQEKDIETKFKKCLLIRNEMFSKYYICFSALTISSRVRHFHTKNSRNIYTHFRMISAGNRFETYTLYNEVNLRSRSGRDENWIETES